jgi:hypothetical protein
VTDTAPKENLVEDAPHVIAFISLDGGLTWNRTSFAPRTAEACVVTGAIHRRVAVTVGPQCLWQRVPSAWVTTLARPSMSLAPTVLGPRRD